MASTANAHRTPITKGQIQLIKIAQKELGLEDDDYRAMLVNNFRVTSCTQLTMTQATSLISRLEHLGFETRNSEPKRPVISRDNGKVVRLVSKEELDKIDVLCSLIEWKLKDGFALWTKKRFDIEKVRTAREAWMVIEGLKKMFANSMAAKHGKAWWTYRFKDQRVMKFIAQHCPEEYKS